MGYPCGPSQGWSSGVSPPAALRISHIPVHELLQAHVVSAQRTFTHGCRPLLQWVMPPDVQAAHTHRRGRTPVCSVFPSGGCGLEHRPPNTRADCRGMNTQSPHVPSTECDCLLCPQSPGPPLHLLGSAPCLPPRPFWLPRCPEGGPPASLACAPWERAFWATCCTVLGQRGASNPFALLTLLVPSPSPASR